MNQPGADSGTEFVLDNRKLIITFLVVVVVCGAFFVIGFMEGKRQSVPTRTEKAPSVPAAVTGSAPDQPNVKAADQPTVRKALEERPGSAQLEWYKNAQAKDSAAQKAGSSAKVAKPAPAPAKPPAVVQPQPSKGAAAADVRSMVPAANVTYTVQVGAFKQKHEADVRAAALKAKGYLCVIDFKSAEQLYLVKVGRFDTRADAKAVQLQLSKDGFTSFIKVN